MSNIVIYQHGNDQHTPHKDQEPVGGNSGKDNTLTVVPNGVLGKEAIHELGHTFELLHCSDRRCVMVSSTYVEGIDLKRDRFCPGCRELLRLLPG